MTKDRNIIGKIKEGDIVRFQEHFLQMLGQISKTSVSSKPVLDSAEYLFKIIREFFHDLPEFISFSELHGQTQINEIPLAVDDSTSVAIQDAFVFFLLEKNIRKITFLKNMTLSELMAFMEILCSSEATIVWEEELLNAKISTIAVEPQVKFPKKAVVESNVEFLEESTPTAAESVSAVEADIPSASERDFQSDQGSPTTRQKRIHIDVLVGSHRLDGASVRIIGSDLPPTHCKDQRGAFLDLLPGEYELEIKYEQYKVKKKVNVTSDVPLMKIVVDLQKIFDY